MRAGEIHPREYDYLLSMSLWSLSEEKIEELTKAMQNKQMEHDKLKGTHPHQLWELDLDEFLEALQKQEDKDERDRLAHKGVKSEARKGGRRPAKRP